MGFMDSWTVYSELPPTKSTQLRVHKNGTTVALSE